MAELLFKDDLVEVWCGDCLDPATVETVMQGRKADLLHVDAPYSNRTHEGHREGKLTADRANGFAEAGDSAIHRYAARKGGERADIDYASWSPQQVELFCDYWCPAVDGWLTTITDHVLATSWERNFEATGLYCFPPLPWVEIGSRVRMHGDGPSPWSCHLIVARPRTKPWSKWGTLQGAYIQPGENKQNRPHRITGGKGLQNTIACLADYSKRGQVVLDTCLGGGTTALAAKMSGRRCIGIEKDHGRAELCARLLSKTKEQRDLFDVAEVGT